MRTAMRTTNEFRNPTSLRDSSYALTPWTDEQLMDRAPSIFARKPHRSRSDRYAYIPTIKIVRELRKNGFVPIDAKQATCRTPGQANYTKHLIRFRSLSDTGRERQLGDLYPEIAMLNSYDGSCRYKLVAGLFRLICLNGMLVSDREFGSLSIMHRGDIVREVIEGSFQVIEESRKAIGVAETWAQIRLSNGEQQALAVSAHTLRFANAEGEVTTAIRPEQLLNVRRPEDRGNSLWQTFNRIQENVMQGGIVAWGPGSNGRQRRTTMRKVTGIDGDVKLNRALWTLGEEMAKLKMAA